MAIIRNVQIKNFRSIQELNWQPQNGINCLIGPGDTGKSTLIDAIDLCLGARRTLQISDSDFHNLNVEDPIEITVTLGALPDSLKNIDSYGFYLRGFDLLTGEIYDEPEKNLDTVLTLRLTIESDLEPQWSLISERAESLGQQRSINWKDRLEIAPTRLGTTSDFHLGWRRGSLLQKLSDEKADASAALTKAARDVRSNFGDQANKQLEKTLEKVTKAANSLGVPVGSYAQALIDAGSISFNGGTISLHNENSIPLNKLGLGSTRLLIAGIQNAVAENSSIILIDELEYGLEPHRIIRLLDALGAKDTTPSLQVFMTTHSPVVVRELSGNQLMIMRNGSTEHSIRVAGVSDGIQGTIRKFPEALLATKILVCEGASEVGLVRGLDQYYLSQNKASLLAQGTTLVDGGGDTTIVRALALQSLGYRVALFQDNDLETKKKKVNLEEKAAKETLFKSLNGKIYTWKEGLALEDALFLYLGANEIDGLLDKALNLRGEALLDDHIKSTSDNKTNWVQVFSENTMNGEVSETTRVLLGKASRSKQNSWFKSVTTMESLGLSIIGPGLKDANTEFSMVINGIFNWVRDESY